jgi:ligand-binding SRPBCC domain-containing protein
LSQSTDQIQKDTIFQYALKVRGIPLKWTTHITDWEYNKYFVDYQSKGPYKIWHHTHEFIAYKGGTLMLDDVKYKVPLGFIGELLLTPFIKMDVNKIFNYRKKIIDEIL